MNKILVVNENYLEKAKPESPLGNLMADLILDIGQKYYQKPIDAALVNYGGIRSFLPKGNITVGNVFEVMPFDNELVVLVISGETMEKLIDHCAKSGGIPLSGFRLTADKQTKKVLEATLGGQPFDPKRNYTVVLSDYMANGGDNCEFLKNPIQYTPLNLLFRDAMLEYLTQKGKQNNTLKPEIDGRIIFE